MSIKNLITDNTKSDQDLQINSLLAEDITSTSFSAPLININSYQSYSVPWATSIVVNATTSTGLITITDWGDILPTPEPLVPNATKPLTIINPLVVSENMIIMLVVNTLGNANNRRVKASINAITVGQFTVDITNTDSVNDVPVGADISFSYAMLHY